MTYFYNYEVIVERNHVNLKKVRPVKWL